MTSLRGSRIVFVLRFADLGGAERQSLFLARRLQRADASVQVLALTGREGRGSQAFRDAGIPWHCFPLELEGGPLARRRVVRSLLGKLGHLRPDVLLPYCTFPNVLCGLAGGSSGAAVRVWNQRDVNPSTRFRRDVVRRALARTPLVVSPSVAGLDFLADVYGLEAGRGTVIPNLVETPTPMTSREIWRARLGIADDAIVAAMLGHVHRFKDHETLVRAWRIVLDRAPAGERPVLLVAGRLAGGEHGVSALVEDLSLGTQVRMLGDVEDVWSLLAASDIGILSSRGEGFANAVAESMAAGLAVAATDISSIREVLGPRDARFLAAPGDDEGLAAAILVLAGDPELRMREGRRNAERASALFSPEQTVDAYARLIAEQLELASGPAPGAQGPA